LVHQVQTMNSIKPTKIVFRDTLKADIYIPIMKVTTQEFPCVIFVSGFAGINFRFVQVYNDWAKLMAANGIIGVVYETNSPSVDFDKLVEYLKVNSKILHLNNDKIGIWSCSGNSLLAVNKVNESTQFKCHSIYYGLTTTVNSQYLKEVEELSKKNGFAFLAKDEYVSKVPTLIIRAGKDNWKIILNSIDEFVKILLTNNIPFELLNYPEGQHAFDILDDNETSKQIIIKTVEFFKTELNR
jgi:dienelactone hydrolase